mgnify:CR=1 FL=1
MGTNIKATQFLKECMADALIKYMSEKDFSKLKDLIFQNE